MVLNVVRGGTANQIPEWMEATVRGIRPDIGGNATSAQRSLIEACWNG
jgi:hypothetical protein